MTSYNAINDTPAPVDTYTADELAQRSWGFTGYSTSDCGAIPDIFGASRHNWAPPGWSTSTTNGVTTWTDTSTGQQVSGAAGAQAWALRAGTQLNCKGDEDTLPNLTEAIQAGVLNEGVIDDALVRVFTMRMSTGEFDPPSRVSYTGIAKDQIQSSAHQQLAERLAANSLVLLKNDPVPGTGTRLLPAQPAGLHHVVIVGDLAGKVTLGGYSGEPALQVSGVRGITDAVQAANPDATVTFDACGTSTTATTPAACSAQTLEQARSADLVVVFVGTDLNVATESHDRATLALPGNYTSLIDQIHGAGNARTVLAVQANGPVAIDTIQQDFPAVVFSAYNGESQGSALADVLLGTQNPTGHLSFTWYKDDSQLPDMQNYGLTPAQTGGLGRTYQYFTGTPTYPFGYGLSYSSFTYTHIQADPQATTPDQRINVHVTVTNTGSQPGATLAQVYATTPATAAAADLPAKRLVGFQKTDVLRPGQSQRLAIHIKASDLAFYDEDQRRQVVYRGRYQFQVGGDSGHIAGSAAVKLTGKITPRVSYVTVQPDRVEFAPGDTLDLRAKNPWIVDDTAPAGEHTPADGIVEAVNNDESFADLTHARVGYRTSNPNVARVSRAGLVTAVAAGVATISVTVNGVTGTTPIVVKQPFGLDLPATITAGGTFAAKATLPNPGGTALTNVTLRVSAPDGWTVRADGPTTFHTLAPGQTATATWTLTAPDTPGRADITADASFRGANGAGGASVTRTVTAPFPSLPSAFDNTGVTDDAQPSGGNLDGGGFSLSAQALAGATPSITPGGSIAHDGLTFTWPGAAPGTPDNVVAGGQTIAISGTGSKLGLIGTGVSGTASGTATVTYTDGSATSVTLSFADWYANSAAAGGDIVATVPYHNTATGRKNRNVSLYFTSIALDPGKTVQYLSLPDISDGVTSGQTSLHIFATGIG
jgi:hypothetical protein